jgi:lambda family phage tail tape measure protein
LPSKSGANAAAVDAAGRANQNFANAMVEFKIQLLAALEPISQLAASLTESGKAVSDFISIILKIGAVVATFFILTKAIALLGAAIVALKVGGAALLTVFTIAVNLFRNFGAIMTQLGGIGGVVSGTFKVLRAYIGDIGAFAMKAIPGLGALAVAFEGLRGYIVSAYNTLKEFFGLSDSGAGAGRGGNDAITKQLQQRGEAVRREAEEARKVVDALEKQRAAIRETSAAYATRNSEIVDTINFEQSLIRKSEDYIAVERAREEVFKRAAQETDKLRKAKAALGPAEQALGAVYDEQIAKIAALAEADAARIAESTQGLENLKILEAARLKDIETTTKLLEDQAQRRLQIEQNVRDIILDGQDKIRQGYESLELEGLGGISKELRQIEIEEKRVAEAARRRVAEQFGDDGDMGQMSQAMKEIDQATKVVIERRQAAAAEIYEQQRSFTQGWKQAFKEYADDATNSAKAAGQIFSTVSRGMEDSIVNFAKTGKFEFKSFAATVLEELLRIQIRKTFAGLLGGGKDSSFGGFFANGGVLGAGKWGIAGEAGPEIISGPAKITPMSDLPQAAPAAPTIVTYNISAVDANSFKQMLAKDPGFLYSVSEQGRRAAPATRR